MVSFGLSYLFIFFLPVFFFLVSWPWDILSSTPVACVMWASHLLLFFFCSPFAGRGCTKDHDCSLDPVTSRVIPVHILLLWQLTVSSLNPLPPPFLTQNRRFSLGTKDKWNRDVWSVGQNNFISCMPYSCQIFFPPFLVVYHLFFFLCALQQWKGRKYIRWGVIAGHSLEELLSSRVHSC